jgi:hypothetical protein
MKSWLLKILFVLCAAICGIGSSIYIVRYANIGTGSIDINGWKTLTPFQKNSSGQGQNNSRLYSRAITAVRGLLALDPKEAIYLVKYSDDDGHLLRPNCTYSVSGKDFPARWWSLTAYAGDYYLFDAPNQHYSIDESKVSYDAQQEFHITLGPKETKEHFWIPTLGKDPYLLTLRLYNVSEEFLNNPQILKTPKIHLKGNCL